MSDPSPLQPQGSNSVTPTSTNASSTAPAPAASARPRPNWGAIIAHGVKHAPVITAVVAIAIAVTVAWWMKVDISPLVDSPAIQHGQVWRLFTDIFPHLGVMHLFFNVYWVWLFGLVIEIKLGHVHTALLVVLFAVVSSAGQFALSGSGVGLSGVGYAFFGMLWMLDRKDPRFRGVLDANTVKLFIGWFALCVVLTVAHIWNVGNVAHGAGIIVGVLVGLAIAEPSRRALWGLAAAMFTVLVLWGATIGRPLVNYSDSYAYEQAQQGIDAIKAENYPDAVRYLTDASKRAPTEAWIFFDLGIAYDGMGDTEKADAAYGMAHTLKPDDAKYTGAASRGAMKSLENMLPHK